MIKRVMLNRIGWVLSTLNLLVLIYYSSHLSRVYGELSMALVFTGNVFARGWVQFDSPVVFIFLIDLIPLLLASFWVQLVALWSPSTGVITMSWISAMFFVVFGSIQWQVVGTFVDHLLGLSREPVSSTAFAEAIDRCGDTYSARDIAWDHTKAKNR